MAAQRYSWIEPLAAELATVIAALTDCQASAESSPVTQALGWSVDIRADRGVEGSLAIVFEAATMRALAQRINALDDEASNTAVVNTLKELCSQSIGSLVQQAPFAGMSLTVDSIRNDQVPSADATGIQIVLSDGSSVALAFSGEIVQVSATAAPLVAPLPPATAAAARTPRLEVILDIDLPLVVRFGRTELPLRTLAAIGPGSVIDLGNPLDETVEVLVSNHVIARGEVVIVGGNYGVRVTDVVSAADRVRSMEVIL